jgi:hypothetical protein
MRIGNRRRGFDVVGQITDRLMNLLQLRASLVGGIQWDHGMGAAGHGQDVATQPLKAVEVLSKGSVSVRQGNSTGEKTDEEYPFLWSGVHQLRQRVYAKQHAQADEGRDNDQV